MGLKSSGMSGLSRADGSMPAKLDGIDFLTIGGYANVSGIVRK
jgi:hypothetical protein